MTGERTVPALRLLFLMADEFPTHRPDVAVLFGKELPRQGIVCDLVAQCSSDYAGGAAAWPGNLYLCRRTKHRLRSQLAAFWHDVRMLWKADAREYDAIQVRDKVFAGILGLLRARRSGLPFFFWMSFPMSEGFIEIACREGLSLGALRWLFLRTKGHLGKFLVYRFLLPRCDHVFVQSERMAEDVARRGLDPSRMTPVPMGVDLEQVAQRKGRGTRSPDPLLAYLGVLDRARRLDFLFEVFADVRRRVPKARLLLIGDATEPADRLWLQTKAKELNIEEATEWSGWLPTELAWERLESAHVAVSIVPRGELFDCASPTKVVEYMALGLPVVANDQPDQQKLLTESGAGLSVPMAVDAFSDAILSVISNPSLAREMRSAGPAYIERERSYTLLGKRVSSVYDRLCANDS